MVGTRSPADDEDAAGPSTSAAAAAAARRATSALNEETLDALVVDWLREEAEREKVRCCFCLNGSAVMSSTRWVWF